MPNGMEPYGGHHDCCNELAVGVDKHSSASDADAEMVSQVQRVPPVEDGRVAGAGVAPEE